MQTRAQRRTPHVETVTIALAVLMLAATAHSGPQPFTSIADYLPEDCPTDGSVDLTEHVTRALAERSALYFPGSDDPEAPRIYALRAQLVVPRGTALAFGPNSLVRRLPSRGSLFRLQEYCRISGAVIDGNKYGHWPALKDVGDEGPGVAGTKMFFGIRTESHCLVKDCFVYNSPGGGFCTRARGSKFIRCRAENVGFIDVKFGAGHYSADRDKWSGDGFAIAGPQNIVRDCEAFDCFRWDFNSSHASVRGTTYVDCRGGDINWRSYGFVDFEASGANNRLIRCYSPNSWIVVSSPRAEIIDCVASAIIAHGADYITIRGCTTTRRGIALGWHYEEQDKHYGGKSPLVSGNRIFMSEPGGVVAAAALHVMSGDGSGIVADNIIFACRGEGTIAGKTVSLEGFEQHTGSNQVVYGQWKVDEAYAQPQMIRGYIDWDHIGRHKVTVFETHLSKSLPEIGLEGEPTWKHIIIGEVPFALDFDRKGFEEKWFLPGSRPETRGVRVGWPWNKQVGDIYVPGWYFIDFEVPAEHAGKQAWLYFGAVDSHGTIWLNGTKLGEHDGWDEPFSFEVTGKLAAGANRLVVRSETSLGLAGIYKPIAVVAK